MSVRFSKTCRNCSLVLLFMLIYQFTYSQQTFTKTQKWLQDNSHYLGGRAVLIIYANNKIVFESSVNNLTKKQTILTKIIARRSGKDADEALQDFDAETKLPIASCSKWLSAALVMTFIDDGTLKLTDTLGKFLPIMTKNGKGNITIAQCLSHTTGINAGETVSSIKQIAVAKKMAETIATIAVMPTDTEPGKSFRYSNVGLQLAAAIIEKISGNSFIYEFNKRIGIPCQMPSTDYGVNAVPLAAAGARSTATDYIHFLQMILQNGMYNGKQVLKTESVALMQQNHIPTNVIKKSPKEAGNWNYGFGEWVMDDSAFETRSTMVNSAGFFGSFPWIDTKKQYAAVLFTYNLKNNERHEKYTELKFIVDEEISKSK